MVFEMKPVKCSVCNRSIRTAFGSVLNKTQPVLCRRCFGEQSYGGSSAQASLAPSSPGSERYE
jgi:hypothetical protein